MSWRTWCPFTLSRKNCSLSWAKIWTAPCIANSENNCFFCFFLNILSLNNLYFDEPLFTPFASDGAVTIFALLHFPKSNSNKYKTLQNYTIYLELWKKTQESFIIFFFCNIAQPLAWMEVINMPAVTMLQAFPWIPIVVCNLRGCGMLLRALKGSRTSPVSGVYVESQAALYHCAFWMFIC